MKRRTFLGATAASLPVAPFAFSAPKRIIDSHFHLFDTTRPQGVPWPDPKDKVLYQPALPERYRSISAPFGITGAIEVEASPLKEDNQWVLDLAAKNSFIVGTVGDLEPGKPGFRADLERFHRNPLFLGIRYGNLWGRDLGTQLQNPAFIADIRLLAEAKLVLDTANPTPALVSQALRLSDQVPNLRIVMDHLPQLDFPNDSKGRKKAEADLREFKGRPQIFTKISQFLRHTNGGVPHQLSYYKETIDRLWDIFGEDRVVFGSDWPNSDSWAPYRTVFTIVNEYFTAKGPIASDKYFYQNSKAAYRWKPRGINT